MRALRSRRVAFYDSFESLTLSLLFYHFFFLSILVSAACQRHLDSISVSFARSVEARARARVLARPHIRERSRFLTLSLSFERVRIWTAHEDVAVRGKNTILTRHRRLITARHFVPSEIVNRTFFFRDRTRCRCAITSVTWAAPTVRLRPWYLATLSTHYLSVHRPH